MNKLERALYCAALWIAVPVLAGVGQANDVSNREGVRAVQWKVRKQFTCAPGAADTFVVSFEKPIVLGNGDPVESLKCSPDDFFNLWIRDENGFSPADTLLDHASFIAVSPSEWRFIVPRSQVPIDENCVFWATAEMGLFRDEAWKPIEQKDVPLTISDCECSDGRIKGCKDITGSRVSSTLDDMRPGMRFEKPGRSTSLAFK
jgi:hypothetical protein